MRSRDDFVRYPNTDLGRIFRKNMLKKHFMKESLQIRARTWHRNSPTTAPLRPTTPKRASEQRAGLKPGGAGGHPPRLFASGLSLEKAWIPARDRAGNHLAGANLRWFQRNRLSITRASEAPPPGPPRAGRPPPFGGLFSGMPPLPPEEKGRRANAGERSQLSPSSL